jgi:hypothetical protein
VQQEVIVLIKHLLEPAQIGQQHLLIQQILQPHILMLVALTQVVQELILLIEKLILSQEVVPVQVQDQAILQIQGRVLHQDLQQHVVIVHKGLVIHVLQHVIVHVITHHQQEQIQTEVHQIKGLVHIIIQGHIHLLEVATEVVVLKIEVAIVLQDHLVVSQGHRIALQGHQVAIALLDLQVALAEAAIHQAEAVAHQVEVVLLQEVALHHLDLEEDS